ncbi:hypothetical protein EGT07_02715 [Herbaspirillum sp. HC18]|nr:hypothetical protein EGT07_02715 [Herbaspirillum sp. HC18]
MGDINFLLSIFARLKRGNLSSFVGQKGSSEQPFFQTYSQKQVAGILLRSIKCISGQIFFVNNFTFQSPDL